jgi:hypothetical protein
MSNVVASPSKTSEPELRCHALQHSINAHAITNENQLLKVGMRTQSGSAGWFYPDLDGAANTLFASGISFCGLNGNVTKQELNLLQFASRSVASRPQVWTTRRTKILRYSTLPVANRRLTILSMF